MKKLSLLTLLIGCANSFAVDGQQNNLGAIVSATSEQSDNALRTAESEIDERQDTLRASAFAFYENDLIELDTSYSAHKRYFDKESQGDRNSFTGHTDFKLGKDHNLFDLRISHMRQRQLVSADAIEIEENQDEKQILAVQPSFHTRITPADTFYIQANATDVDYRYEELNNSTREGATVGFLHAFSGIDTLGIFVSHTDVDFEFIPALDYRKQSYALSYATRLRKLEYKLEAGQSKMQSQFDKEDEADTNPYYLLSFTYATGYNQWNLSLSEQYTDSSHGNGGQAGDDSDFGEAGSRVPDQLILKRAFFSWTSAALCERCEFSLNGFRDDREYLTQEKRELANGIAMGVRYSLSRFASIGVRGVLRKQEFEGAAAPRDFDSNQLSIYYNYNFSDGTGVRIFASEFKRESEDKLQDYSELRTGVTLSHRF